MNAPINAFIFDCDGVLIDSETLAVEAGRRFLADAGLHYDRDTYVEQFCGRPAVEILRDLERRSLAELGRPLPRDFGARLNTKEHRAMRRNLQAIAGVVDFATRLAVPKAVASSSLTDSLLEKLEITGLRALFDPHIYSTELVDRGKPAPDLFLHAAAAIGQAPSGCVVVEDSVNGVRAGVAAGMTVWGFIGGGHASARLGRSLAAAGASRVFDSFAAMHAHHFPT